ncbi:MAG: hypothetical protein IT530_01040 [Burkholderiales bacterium]|nr:hypothetical protein [Burkholderiales bacterium]
MKARPALLILIARRTFAPGAGARREILSRLESDVRPGRASLRVAIESQLTSN